MESSPFDEDLQESEEIAELDGLVESLDPRGDFTPEQWVFEQLNLQLPVVNHCGDHCPGPPGLKDAATPTTDATPPTDPRWDALRQLQQP